MATPATSQAPVRLSADQKNNILNTLKYRWKTDMPAFTTLNCMLTLWRVNGCQFWNLPDVENISLEGSDDGNDDDDAVGAVAVITREEESLYLETILKFYTKRGLEILFSDHPELKNYLMKSYDVAYAAQLSAAASSLQSMDTFFVRDEIFNYLLPSDNTPFNFKIPHSLPKDQRGLGNHTTARFLIPRKHLDAFERDPDRTIAKFKAGGDPNWQLIAEEWPTFLYDEEAGWSEANIRKGLFRGHVLVRVALRVFRNKSSADSDRIGEWFDANKRRKGPKCMLERYELDSVSPSMIAYAALQAYVALSSMETWGIKDGDFNLSELYHLIIKVLSTEDEWVARTMYWWQRKVFGDGRVESNKPQEVARFTNRTSYQVMSEQNPKADDRENAMRTYPRWVHRGQRTVQDAEGNKGNDKGADEEALSSSDYEEDDAMEQKPQPSIPPASLPSILPASPEISVAESSTMVAKSLRKGQKCPPSSTQSPPIIAPTIGRRYGAALLREPLAIPPSRTLVSPLPATFQSPGIIGDPSSTKRPLSPDAGSQGDAKDDVPPAKRQKGDVEDAMDSEDIPPPIGQTPGPTRHSLSPKRIAAGLEDSMDTGELPGESGGESGIQAGQGGRGFVRGPTKNGAHLVNLSEDVSNKQEEREPAPRRHQQGGGGAKAKGPSKANRSDAEEDEDTATVPRRRLRVRAPRSDGEDEEAAETLRPHQQGTGRAKAKGVRKANGSDAEEYKDPATAPRRRLRVRAYKSEEEEEEEEEKEEAARTLRPRQQGGGGAKTKGEPSKAKAKGESSKAKTKGESSKAKTKGELSKAKVKAKGSSKVNRLDAEEDEEREPAPRRRQQGTGGTKKKGGYKANRSDEEEDEGQILARGTGGREARATEKKAKTKTSKN